MPLISCTDLLPISVLSAADSYLTFSCVWQLQTDKYYQHRQANYRDYSVHYLYGKRKYYSWVIKKVQYFSQRTDPCIASDTADLYL